MQCIENIGEEGVEVLTAEHDTIVQSSPHSQFRYSLSSSQQYVIRKFLSKVSVVYLRELPSM